MSREIPKCFPDSVQFRHAWRPYQARVIAELDSHLKDNHFHLVAAPGSGKTVVGLEVLRRLGKPALVFAPTVAIRDQWIRRFLDSFWNEAQPPYWLSTDLSEPRLLTITTYQSLTHFEKTGEVGALVAVLEAAGVGTLVFDEAHHLRNQWWKTLDRIKAGLKSPVTVALTATPPYDVTQIEWNRYAAICGAVDEEISTPELVKAKNLCPHQDFIYLCEPTVQERAELEKFERGIAAVLADVALNEAFIQAVRQHPVVANPADHIDELLGDSDYYLSLAVFLKHSSGVAPETLLRSFGVEEATLPPFNRGWGEVLFTGMLFSDRESFRQHEDAVAHLQRELSACGAIDRRTVLLRSSAHNIRLLRSSSSKLPAVADIVELESRTMDWRLRMLVLTDFIRDEDFPDVDGVEKKFTKIGVIPIFEYLRKLRLPNVWLGVMTGRLAIMPNAALASLEFAAHALGIDAAQFSRQQLWYDPAYTHLEFSAGDGGRFLELATRLFSEGDINVLIGTAALLGEGWDAPAVNSLVMATVIGSYVSSNQIRGRAIRSDPQDPFKTATIWHLACVHCGEESPATGTEPEEPDFEHESDDWTTLARRFRAFVGLRQDSAVIENGIERLGIGKPTVSSAIARSNARMCRDVCKRDEMAEAWQRAIFHPAATQSRVVSELFIPVPRIPSHPVMRRWLRNQHGWFGRLRGWWLERRTLRIAQSLLESFQGLGLIGQETPGVTVSTGRQDIRVRLTGVNCREESLFVSAMREIFDPLQSPRYLLVTKDEEFAVPRVFAERKERAESFARRWREKVGNARLIYSHTQEGKRRLLRAKERFLTSRHPLRTQSRLLWG
ncbi:MAG TPA: DEAD/DEAH box helicase family protein [Steroidobacteraceae bacterium]|nr:DEAD/DEAH box helicase family protein [Steroidobacteraceae bacterium]